MKDEKFIWLIRCILDNYGSHHQGEGMPLGNWTSQFFANVYLNELDQFVKHMLKAKYYIRYVDDFIVMHSSEAKLREYLEKIKVFLTTIRIELNQNKTSVIPLKRGVSFLGYRVFYHYKLLRKKNIWKIKNTMRNSIEMYKKGQMDSGNILHVFESWSSYAMHADTYNFRQTFSKRIEEELVSQNKI